MNPADTQHDQVFELVELVGGGLIVRGGASPDPGVIAAGVPDERAHITVSAGRDGITVLFPEHRDVTSVLLHLEPFDRGERRMCEPWASRPIQIDTRLPLQLFTLDEHPIAYATPRPGQFDGAVGCRVSFDGTSTELQVRISVWERGSTPYDPARPPRAE